MRILVTGASGFVGKNLCAELENIAEGKRRNAPLAPPLEIMRFDVDGTAQELCEYCSKADFIVNLAGVNRPKDEAEFMTGNAGFAQELVSCLEGMGRAVPILLSSSSQAALDNPYGRSKRMAEQAVREYGQRTGADTFIYRFPNLFGKWCRPNYNSVVATFCHNTANGLPIRVDDGSKLLRLAYIDDVVDEIIACIAGIKRPGAPFCEVEKVHERTLGEIASLIGSFPGLRENLLIPDVSDPFIKALYSTYLSYVPAPFAGVACETKRDERGSFTELLRTEGLGQVSVNVCRPGYTKGNHWHHTKTERFIVVSGEGVIRERRIGDTEVTEIPVCGGSVSSVDMLPGYTHSIENTGKSDLVFIIWANERFDPERPDTFFEKVLLED